ncbi:MAG TPA: DUF4174 domain-containing protein [Christiangramia sp.]|nr:DUF4174 domain-containing protein [Christiangramia sp.]
MKKYLLITFLIFTPLTMLSQSLSEYQWENRLIVIFTDSDNSEKFQNQMEILNEDQKGLEDRKLKVLQAIPGNHQIVFPQKTNWQNSNLYQKKESKTDFEVILIGLDGGVKLRQTKPVETKQLFGLIDSMPMRQAEMRRNKN